jgi:hypothetical protein
MAPMNEKSEVVGCKFITSSVWASYKSLACMREEGRQKKYRKDSELRH